jgi:hypothetical protein
MVFPVTLGLPDVALVLLEERTTRAAPLEMSGSLSVTRTDEGLLLSTAFAFGDVDCV